MKTLDKSFEYNTWVQSENFYYERPWFVSEKLVGDTKTGLHAFGVIKLIVDVIKILA